MKLYEMTKQTKFKISGYKETFLFDHIDGAYSVCYTLPDKEVVHLSASTEVVPL